MLHKMLEQYISEKREKIKVLKKKTVINDAIIFFTKYMAKVDTVIYLPKQ